MIKKENITIEFILAIIIAFLLIVSLLSKRIFEIPNSIIIVLLLSFLSIKTYHIIKQKGTIFEDYASLSIIVLFGLLNFFMNGSKLNTAILTVIIIAILYSTGIIPSINKLSKTTSISSFMISYIIFIIAIIFLFAGTYAINNHEFVNNNEKIIISFEESIYFSTMTFTTVGYGDLSPVGVNRIISSIEAIMGIVLNIAFIGYILASKRFEAKKISKKESKQPVLITKK